MENKVAIVDLGTNTFHLMIAEWNGSRYQIIHRERAAVKIGMGGINKGVILDEAVARALVALQHFQSVIQQQRIQQSLVFGTSALRSAKNGQQVADKIKEATGLSVHIISGDEEAGLIYEGVKQAGVLDNRTALIVDIGGGSVEFIIATAQTIFWKQSFDIGAQRLLEQYQKHDPILNSEIEAINDHLTESLRPLLDQIDTYHPSILVGSSGTFDTLSEIHCLEKRLPYHDEMPETPLTIESFVKTFDVLLKSNREQRMKIPGMIEMRVDMIVVACCLIKFLVDHARLRDIKVSTYSLKEGVMASLK